MRAERYGKNSGAGEKVTMLALSPSKQTRTIQEAVARRACEIFVSLGAVCGHELKPPCHASHFSSILHSIPQSFEARNIRNQSFQLFAIQFGGRHTSLAHCC